MTILWGLIELLSLVALIVGLVWRFSKKNKEDVQKKKQGRNVAVIGVVALFVSGLIMSNLQNSEAQQTKIDGKIVTYKQLNKKVTKLKSDLSQLQSDKTSLSDQISDLQSKHKDVMTAIDNKNKLYDQVSEAKDNLSSIKSDISDAKGELSSINGKVDSAKTALAQAKGEVTKAKSAPKTLGAGKYTVGNDIKAGRYKVTPVGSGSNFFVFGDGDETDVIVNTILGSDGEPSYTFEASDGDVIQTEATVKLTPIE